MATLNSFLKQYNVKGENNPNNNPPTHTRIGDKDSQIFGGSYYIPQDKLSLFYDLYCDDIFNKKNKEYLTEKQNGSVIAIDLDFRYSYDVAVRLHTDEQIEKLTLTLLEELKNIYETIDESFNIYIMEKPNVNRVADKNITKDGIHIIIPLKLEFKYQLELRKKLLPKLPEIFESLPLTNSWEQIYDEGISKGCVNWQLYGSRKPNNEAYQMTYIYKCELDKADNEFMMESVNVKSFNIFENFKYLSVQNIENKTYPVKIKIDTPMSTVQILQTPQSISSDNTKDDELEKIEYFIDNGFNDIIKDKHIHNDISNIGSALSNEFDEAGLDLFLKIASNYSTDYDKTEYETKYNSYLKNKSNKKEEELLTIKSIYYMFKNYDEELFKKLNKTFSKNRYITTGDLYDNFKTAEIISKTLKHQIKYCKDTWYVLNPKTHLWIIQKDPQYYIINEIRKYIDSSIKVISYKLVKETDEVKKENLRSYISCYTGHYVKINASSYLSTTIKFLKTILLDNDFSIKINVLKNCLAFKNGIYDLEKLTLRPISGDDFITETIPYDYEAFDNAKLIKLRSYLKQILNNKDDHLEYFLSIIGFCFLATPHLEKSAYCCVDGVNGKGDNGKTFYFDILTALMPNYVYKSKGTLLEDGNTKLHKQMIHTKGKRLVWIDEFSKVKKTNAELIKVMADGKTIENEVMFGTSEIIQILYKPFILTNHIPTIDPTEIAVFNRYKQITYCSHFDRSGERKEENIEKLEFIADTNLSDDIKDNYYNEVFQLIIQYANNYIRNKKLPNIPSQFIADAKKTKDTNDEYGMWFEENIKIDATKRVPLKLLLSKTEFNKKQIIEGMLRKNFVYNKDLMKMGKDEFDKFYKGGFEGCEYTPTVNDETDEEDNYN